MQCVLNFYFVVVNREKFIYRLFVKYVKMMEKRIGGRLWYFDMALNSRANTLEELMVRQRKLAEKIDNSGNDAVIVLSPGGKLIREAYLVLPAELDQREVKQKDILDQKVTIGKRLFDLMKKARPILLGPSTLDSLINETPETYECISNEYFPFQNMFFEFYESVTLDMPFADRPREIVGVHFYPTRLASDDGVEEKNKYVIEVYYTRNAKVRSMLMTCNPEVNAQFEGSTLDVKFNIDMDSRTMKYSMAEEIRKEVINGNFEHVNTYAYHREVPLDEIGNSDFFVKIANFCVNVINYINSDNKETVVKTREVQIKRLVDNNGKKKSTVEKRQEPYSIINITPVRYEGESTPTGTHWTLQEQIMVRGHNRRYKDDDGKIRKIIRIDSHRKGPEDAPWRNQRYKMMYEAQQREKKMLETGERF